MRYATLVIPLLGAAALPPFTTCTDTHVHTHKGSKTHTETHLHACRSQLLCQQDSGATKKGEYYTNQPRTIWHNGSHSSTVQTHEPKWAFYRQSRVFLMGCSCYPHVYFWRYLLHFARKCGKMSFFLFFLFWMEGQKQTKRSQPRKPLSVFKGCAGPQRP